MRISDLEHAYYVGLGRNLRIAMVRSRLTQETLARSLGMDVHTLHMNLHGRYRMNLRLLRRILGYVGMSYDDIVTSELRTIAWKVLEQKAKVL